MSRPRLYAGGGAPRSLPGLRRPRQCCSLRNTARLDLLYTNGPPRRRSRHAVRESLFQRSGFRLRQRGTRRKGPRCVRQMNKREIHATRSVVHAFRGTESRCFTPIRLRVPGDFRLLRGARRDTLAQNARILCLHRHSPDTTRSTFSRALHRRIEPWPKRQRCPRSFTR